MMRLISVLQKCDCVFVPNEGTKQSLKAMTRTDNIKVILPFARLYDTPEEDILDKGYVAIAARKYTIDSTEKWLPWALSELNIPHISVQRPSHAKYLADPKNYTDFLNHCSFVVSAKLEASTGGMSLVEAYNNGKPVLIPNSSLHGGNDIFGDRAYKYDYGSYDSLKSSLQYLWEKRPKQNLKECREFCKNFTVDALSERIYEAMK